MKGPSFAVAWCAALFVATTAPHLLGTFAPPPGHDGFGSIMFVNDFAQYEAAMAEGQRSPSWLVHDHFTPEPHEPAFMFPLYVGMGKLSGALGVDAIVVYRVVELLGRLAALSAIAWLATSLIPRGGRLAAALGTAGAGLGIWAALAQAALGVPDPYVGNGSYELNNYALLFAPPHVTLGMAATLTIVALLVQAEASWSQARALLLVGTTMALCLLHPFNTVTLGLGAGLLLLSTAFEPATDGRKIGPFGIRSLLAAGLVGLAATPFVLYNALTFTRSPFWGQAYGAQNILPSPAPHELIVDLGVLLLIGIPALVGLLRQPGTPRRLALFGLLMLALMYAPVPFQRRFAFGVAPLLGAIAGATLAMWYVSPARSPRLQRLGLANLVVLALGSPLIIFGGLVASTWLNAPIAVYRATPELRAARDWLATNTTRDDVVLASWDVANYLAGAIPGRTTGGHPVATLRTAERKAEAATIFAGPSEQASAIQRENPSLLVAASSSERIFLHDPDTVFHLDDITVLRIRSAGAP